MRKNSRWMTVLLCLLLCLGMILPLAGCPADDPTPGPTPTPTPADPEIEYGNGGELAGTGTTMTAEDFAMTAHTVSRDGATTVTARQLVQMFREGTVAETAVYVVTGTMQFLGAGDLTYNGKGSAFFFDDGLLIEQCEQVKVTNMLIYGNVQVRNCQDLILDRVDIQSETGSALTLDGASQVVALGNCRLTSGSGTAIVSAAKELTLQNTAVLYAEQGLDDSSQNGLTVQNCYFAGNGTAIRATGREVTVRGNTIEAGNAAVGVALYAGNTCGDDGKVIMERDTASSVVRYVLHNGLIAENIIKDAKVGVLLDGVTNTAVVVNSLKGVEVTNGHSVYVCDNQMGAFLRATNVEYLLADGNAYPSDGYTHGAIQTNLTNPSGNTLLNVDARLEYGADEALLPQVDRDLFVGADSKSGVKDVAYTGEKSVINEYIMTVAGAEGADRVIVAPGKYSTAGAINLSGSNYDKTDIYAYGVYMERANGLGSQMNINNVQGLNVKGMLFAFKQQSCGQVYVLQKMKSNNLLVVTGAGMMNEFGNTNGAFYSTTGMGAQHQGTFYAYADLGFNSITKGGTTLGLDTMVMEVSSGTYGMIEAGDVLTCRASNGGTTIPINNSSDVVFYDVTLYGGAAGFAFVEGSNTTATTYYRLLDTTRTGEIIDKDLYDDYVALAEAYSDEDSGFKLDLEITVDELGRYRGSPAHIGSIDATHTTKCAEGSQAIFCLFENMCDDGTNQNAGHARLHDYEVDKENNTVTFTYKGNLSEYSWQNSGVNPSGLCYNFREGDRVYIYTSIGRLVYDGPALSDAVKGESGSGLVGYYNSNGTPNISRSTTGTAKYGTYTTYTVTVPLYAEDGTCYFNEDALKDKGDNGADGTYADNIKTDNRWFSDYKVLVDNMSMSSNGFVFDNTMVRNIRSRGLLIKASNAVIKNCTFNHVGMGAIAINYEIYWGESGVTENLEVSNNLFDHTGYFADKYMYSAISIDGLGEKCDEDYLLYKNINVTHNKIINRTTTYAFYVRGAKDVTFADNYVGVRIDEDERLELGKDPSKIAWLEGAANVKFENNYYQIIEDEYVDPDITNVIVGRNYRNIFGKDVMDEYGELMLPDKVEN